MLHNLMCCFHSIIIAFLFIFVHGCGIKKDPYYKTPTQNAKELFRIPTDDEFSPQIPHGVPLIDESTLQPKSN